MPLAVVGLPDVLVQGHLAIYRSLVAGFGLGVVAGLGAGGAFGVEVVVGHDRFPSSEAIR